MVDFNAKLKALQAQRKLKARMRAATEEALPSLVPLPKEPPKKHESEVLPDIQEVIESRVFVRHISNLVEQDVAWQAAAREARAERKGINGKIKKILEVFGEVKFMSGGNRVCYFNAPRRQISKQLLLDAGVSPVIIKKCTTTKDAWTLKITPPGEEEDTDE